ncbi:MULTISPECIES: PepSY domain-containing protein [Hyphobacterium]|uniref:PepSY domain-containing protein n=1 Tax=Hyphobacterium vulgare TaxID=1736751 RepID=A0ABV6ZW56_9PROT|nr:PepSY domain-containing protein [Hyphobacterium sp. SN044]MBI1234364.1 PepSY domain-containing protein [Alphaproteobacteria bacterium]MCF8881006.1 PepSY domain-containing protein [Hyphobacterium sp. SN044]
MTALLRWTIRVHKWIALVVGIQIVLWVMGGVVMSVIPIERVRGEHNMAALPDTPIDPSSVIAVGQAAEAAFPGLPVRTAHLQLWQGQPVWNVVVQDGRSRLVDAATGEVITPITRERAIEIAVADYAGDPEIAAIEYFEDATWESRRPGPAWRVSFDDGEGTRIYVSPDSGLVTARRNDAWRFYDFFWMLHIMDYDERENFNNPLLITAALLALLTVFAGLLLLVLRMQRLVRMELAQHRRKNAVPPET